MSDTKKRPDNPYFKDGVDYTWQTTKEFNDLVKVFRDECAIPPKMKEAKEMHRIIIDELIKKLKEKPLRCSRLEYTGSAYEKVKVSKGKDDDDLEFDIMVIIEGGRELTKDSSETPPGYVLLHPSDESAIKRFQKQTTDGYVSADKVASHFMGQLSACIDEIQKQVDESKEEDVPDELRHIKDNIILRKHGPAIQMDVFRNTSTPSSNGDRGKPFYSVDMVPTFEMVVEGSQKEYYVAKPLKGVDFTEKPKMKFAWRRSFSLDEKERLVDMDKNNTCKKSIFRMLKVIRNRECGLALLTSYHLKTVLLRELEHRPDNEDWTEDLIGKRLMDVINRLVSELGSEIKRPVAAAAAAAAAATGVRRRQRKDDSTRRVFRKGKMPHLFIPQINLLDSIDNRACACIYYRFKHLKNSKRQMETILNGDSKPRRKKKSKKKAVKAEDKSAAKSKTKTKAVKRHTSFRYDPEFCRVLDQLILQLDSIREVQVNSHPLSDNPDGDDDGDNDDCDIYAGNCDVDDDIDYLDMLADTGDNSDFDM